MVKSYIAGPSKKSMEQAINTLKSAISVHVWVSHCLYTQLVLWPGSHFVETVHILEHVSVSDSVSCSDGNTLYPRSFKAASICLEDL